MTRTEFKTLAGSGIILDGATGTELAKLGMPAGVSPEVWVCRNPQSIISVHEAYRNAGSQILYAPTFGANRCKLAEFGVADQLQEIITTLVGITKEHSNGAFIFGDIAPTGRFIAPGGDMEFEEAVSIYRECAVYMKNAGADGFAIETMMDLQEARAALIGCREAAPDMPVIVTMTFEKSGRSLTGVDPVSALITLQSLGADAFGCNCSTGPEDMAKVLSCLRPYARIPLVAKPNAGLPKLEHGKTVFRMSPAEFGAASKQLVEAGAAIVGGCCGTTPAHIAALSKVFRSNPLPPAAECKKRMICSASSYRQISPDKQFTLIGERINPTGKKALQAELKEGKTDLVLDFALQQSAAGAAVLDINMGMPGIDEKNMMLKSMQRILKSASPLLCIDSTDPETVEAALRFYPGRALLNSISAETHRLQNILPVVAKYGAMVVILPLTDDGIPETAARRLAVVEQILEKTRQYGIDDCDVCVDALIMAVATLPDAAQTSLEVIAECSRRKINTVCGLSNVSFGLPQRQLINRTFLGMAIGCGLNMAIANPLFPEIMEQICAGDLLANRENSMNKFLSAFSGQSSSAASEKKQEKSPAAALFQAVLNGNREGVPALTDALLASGTTPADAINNVLIPAITEVGDRYERKEFFLPQLIAGAEAMQAGTAYLEPMLLQNSSASGEKTKLIIATVKGDIHDIGKNIVAVILRNYDFEVIDLGKDVPAETIIDTAVKENVKVILLSALMTTTMHSMQEVIQLAAERKLDDLKFIVGGAVVDQTFADENGAFYAATPMDAMRWSKKLNGLES